MKIAKQRYAEIAKGYRDGLSGPDLAQRFSVTAPTVYRVLRACGVVVIQNGLSKRKRRHTVNETAFDSVTEDSAYWVGFLMADGCVLDNGALKLCLAAADSEHLETFRRFLRSSHAISRHANGVIYQLRSRKIAAALASYGVVPRKTFTARVVGLEQNRHFWRGVIDGDGHIGKHLRGSSGYITLVGSDPLMRQFREFVTSHTASRAEVHRRGNVATFKANGLEIIKVLYSDCSVALRRKLETARRLVS